MADQAEKLRNIIKAQSQPRPQAARVIAVTSGKGGVGKSNTAINLAIQFRKLDKRVIILDADFGLANIEIMFGTVPKGNLSDLIYRGKNILDIITWGPMDVGFISGGSGIAGMGNLSREYLNYIVQNLVELDNMADVIIIDTGAGISNAVLEFLVASNEVILVTTPDPTSITDSYSLIKAIKRDRRYSQEYTSIHMLANKVRNEEEGDRLYAKVSTVASRFLQLQIEYLGYVPQDEQLAQAVVQQTPVSIQNPSAKSAVAYRNIVMKLMHREEEIPKVKHGMMAFFSHIISGRR